MTAGASAPEILVKRVVDRIRLLTGAEVSRAIGVEERISFSLPRELAFPVAQKERRTEGSPFVCLFTPFGGNDDPI